MPRLLGDHDEAMNSSVAAHMRELTMAIVLLEMKEMTELSYG